MKRWLVGLMLVSGMAQAEGLALAPDNPHYEFIADDPSRDRAGSVFQVITIGSLIAGLHLINQSDKAVPLDPAQFVVGPVTAPGDSTKLCVSVRTLSGSYDGAWSFAVQSDTSGLSPRKLASDYAARLREMDLKQAVINSRLSGHCGERRPERYVAAGYSDKPDTFELFLELANAVPAVEMTPESGGAPVAVDCDRSTKLRGYRCTKSLSDLAAGDYTLSVTVTTFDGRDPFTHDFLLRLPGLADGGSNR